MTTRTRWPLLRVVLAGGALVAGAVVLPAGAEVSVDVHQGRVTGLSLLEVGGGGGEPLPWPTVRTEVPAAWILNPGGNDRQPADGSPSLGWDPAADRPEVCWARHDGHDYEIVISHWTGDGWSPPRSLTANDVDDTDPRIGYGPDGTARIAFQRGDRVWVVRRPPGEDWTAPEEVDVGGQPSVAADPVDRVAYQQVVAGGPQKDVRVARRLEDGSWLPETLATTSFAGLDGTGNIDVRLHHSRSTGVTWVDWEDSSDALGWCRLEPSGTWSAPRYEPLAGPDDEEAARLRIAGEAQRSAGP